MSTQDQYIQLSSLPEDVRKQVLAFIEFLLKREQPPKEPFPKKKQAKPVSGLLKGKVKMADDFDAPLDDFREYMA